MNSRTALSSLAATVLFHATASAQFVVYDMRGNSGADLLGTSIARIHDLDADGTDDFAIGIPRDDSPIYRAGRVRVFSGANGSVLRTYNGSVAYEELGAAVADVGDIDHDGKHDIAVGSRFYGPVTNQVGAVRVYSGATGATLLFKIGPQHLDNYGASLAGIGDADNDGTPDLIVGAPNWDAVNATDVGFVHVLSGASGAVLDTLSGPQVQNTNFGWAIAAAGDVDMDGGPDFIVGAPFESTAGDRTGTLRVYRGSTRALLHTIHGEQLVMTLAKSVSGAGDVDGDGHADFLAGAPHFENTGSGIGHVGLVRLYSGATGLVLRELQGTTLVEQLGLSVRGGTDMDGDDVPDIVAAGSGIYESGLGVARVYSGATGIPLQVVTGTFPGAGYGSALEILGDVTGDNRPDFAVGAPRAATNENQAGQVVVWRTFEAPTTYCIGLPNSVGSGARIAWSGSTSISANQLTLSCSGLSASTPGLYFFGTTQTQLPFGDGYRCVGGAFIRIGIVFASSGTATLPVDMAQIPAASAISSGEVRCFQFWYRDTVNGGSGFNLSDALSIPFCP